MLYWTLIQSVKGVLLFSVPVADACLFAGLDPLPASMAVMAAA